MDLERNMDEEKDRKGFLYPLNIWALSFGGIIGWGAFVMPGTMFLPNAGPVGTIIAMVLGGLIMLAIGKNFSVMAERFPDNGGIFAYTRLVLGNDHGFLAAWSLGLAYLSLIWANATAFVLIARYLFGDIFQWGFHYQVAGFDVFFGEILVTWIILIAYGLLACYGGKMKRHLHTALGLILLLSVVGLFVGIITHTHHSVFAPAFQPDTSPPLQIFSMLMLAPWMFFGFEAVTHASEDFNFAPRKLYPIVVGAVVSGALVYCMLTSIAVLNIPGQYSLWTDYIIELHTHEGTSAMPVFQSAYSVLGSGGLVLLGAAIIAALSTSLLGFYRATGYLFHSMAAEKLLPEKFAQTGPDGLPQKAILLVLCLSLPVPFLGRTAIAWLTDITTISGSLAYGYVSLCAYHMAKEEGSRPRQALGIFGTVVSALFFVCPILPDMLLGTSLDGESYLLLAGWSLVGFICYWYVFKHDREHRFGISTSMCLIVLFLNFFSTSLWLRQTTEGELLLAAHGIDTSYSLLTIQALLQMGLITVILVLMSDIFTTIKKREHAVDVQMFQERAISKAKNDLLANISHDVRIPMQAIVGYVQTALELSALCYVCENPCQRKVPKVIGDSLERIESLNQYLSALINDMQLSERMEKGHIKMKEHLTDIRHTMQVLEHIFANHMQEKRLYFTVDTSKVTDSQVICDEERLSRVILNLISNAYHYTEPGGGVMVTLLQKGPGYHARKTENGRLAFKTYADYEFHVQDTGKGLSPEELEWITAPFEGEKTSQDLETKGRGLHIAKNIIKLMGGQLAVTTEPGSGTEFVLHISLPLAPK